ncbi:Putative ribosome biogenesis protein [Galdieria sulphuraria]|uniref:60S ribosomal protein-related protein n=1 Tax=Galdieria sulphuraria TaxID=130081 RepID=M2XFU3_GALSU|nr:60S ribosomal protein-related protein [Galdieria sulphuraria]EME28892.1 60S ribosomal protein-related protein [Galdieria sulphuraria]GJD08281.1 Putative ribosome biogenesis protein [Galdieria sulphuraria]|eukprot:XP_005705412.1 60S ribosomal protein-related protein [Galdieria sulphuraria]
MSSSPVPSHRVVEAVQALRVLREQNDTKTRHSLLKDNEDFIFLVVTFKQLPERKSWKPCALPLPHPIYVAGESEVCFIVKDPQRQIKDYIADHHISGISKVIGVSKLRKKYSTFALKRQFVQAYDLFLADDRVVPMLAKTLGKECFRKKKVPIPIRMNKDIGRDVQRALNRTYLFCVEGPCSSARIGKMSFDNDAIIENVLSCVGTLFESSPGGWENIQSLLLKTVDSLALPIFQSYTKHESVLKETICSK